MLLPLAAGYAQSSGPTYVVQPGDSLFSIAQRFGTSVELLAEVNNISDPSLIAPGLELIIPGYQDVTGALELKQINFGESLASLSERYQLSEESIVRLNRILHPEQLYVGQSLILPTVDEEQIPKFVQLTNRTAGRLEVAIEQEVNPWTLGNFEGEIERGWLIPEEPLLLLGGERAIQALPAPLLSIQVDPQRAVQGHTLVIRAEHQENLMITGSVGDWNLTFTPMNDNEQVALLGIHALADPGLYDLRINVLDESGEEAVFIFSQPLRVASGEYWFDPVLYVPPETIDPLYTGPENELIASIVRESTMEKYWDGAFQFPSHNITAFPSYFGARRNYNDTGYTSYHTGLDFYGGIGSEIMAPARGVVVFAGALDVRGNVTFIDHGLGIFTGYLHQSELQVSVGDMVELNQIIGLVGNTGRVTGPHLHWEVWVGGNPVDPFDWVENVYP
jgi:murein DD-endopeptidase MepM/ murein hydrolase activator NlpD